MYTNIKIQFSDTIMWMQGVLSPRTLVIISLPLPYYNDETLLVFNICCSTELLANKLFANAMLLIFIT